MKHDATPRSAPSSHPVVTRDEWLAARIALLAEEKAFTRKRDELSQKVRDLPWVKVDKTYTFDAPTGPKSLGDLFGLRSQLITYHFMFDPTWSQGCMGCSFIADHYNGIIAHLAHRDISLVTVSKAPCEKLGQFRRRMGWTFPWVSAANNDFGRDYGVSFTDQELASDKAVYNFTGKAGGIREFPGLSVFFNDASGTVFHTYSTFARGMGWVRHHDRYDDTNFVVPWLEKPGVSAPLPKKG